MTNIDSMLGGLLREYEQYKTKHKLQTYEEPMKVVFVKNMILRKFGVSVHHLYKIFFHIITVQNKAKFLFSNLVKNPFDFITPEEILIPYAVADAIDTSEKLLTSRNIRYKCWTYETILETHKRFYVCPKRLKTQMTEFFGNEDKTKAFIDKNTVRHGNTVTLPYYKKMETTLQQRFMGLTFPVNYNKDDLDLYISDYKLLSLTEHQHAAIHKCVANNLHVVCGYPGTGKSTIIQLLSSYFKRNDMLVYFTAPTGLAIKGLLSKLNDQDTRCCGTLHKLIYTVFPYIELEESDEQSNNAKNYKIPDVIIVDEFSMVDMLMLKQLIKVCIKFKCRLYLFGDSNQLPPVGPGNPLRRLSENKAFSQHVTYLTEIKRQSNELLVSNIHRVNEGTYILDEHFDGTSMTNIDYETILCPVTKKVDYNKMAQFITEYKLDVHNTQFLSPENKKNCGIQEMNKVLQRFYNKGPFIHGVPFKLDDRVVRTQNKYDSESDYMYANGDMGKIVKFVKAYPVSNVIIEYDTHDQHGLPVKEEVSMHELQYEFQLRYCLSIHKSQGSEYDNVILFVGNPHKSSSWNQTNAKKLLYTALSRTKQKCFIVSNKGLLNIAQTTTEDEELSSFF